MNGEAGAFGCYAWDAAQKTYTGLSLDVLTLDGTPGDRGNSCVTSYTRAAPPERWSHGPLL